MDKDKTEESWRFRNPNVVVLAAGVRGADL
jgi:hypothetical protein